MLIHFKPESLFQSHVNFYHIKKKNLAYAFAHSNPWHAFEEVFIGSTTEELVESELLVANSKNEIRQKMNS